MQLDPFSIKRRLEKKTQRSYNFHLQRSAEHSTATKEKEKNQTMRMILSPMAS